jgi:hypothetical protein
MLDKPDIEKKVLQTLGEHGSCTFHEMLVSLNLRASDSYELVKILHALSAKNKIFITVPGEERFAIDIKIQACN